MMTEMLNRGLANNATDAMLIETAKDVAHANGYYHINELLDFYSKITNGAPVSEATRAYLAQVQQDAVNEGYGFRVVRQGVKAAAVSAGVPFDESLLNDGINGNGDIWGGNWTQDRVNEIYKEITGGKEIAPAILPRYEFSPDTSESIVRDSLRRLAIASGQYHPDEIKAVYASLTNGAVISEQDLALAREAADQLNYDRAQLQSYLRGVATDNHQLAATSEINNLTYEQLRNMYLEMTDTTWGENDLTLHDKFDAGAFNGLTVEEVKTKLSDMAFNNGHYSIKFVEDAYVNLTGQQPSEETIRSIRYAADLRNAGPNRLNDIIREYAIAAGDMNGDGTVLPPETLPPAAGGGAAGGTGSSSGGAGTSGTPTSSANHQYKLISGNGPALGEGQLRGNGNAVFLVSSSGELFHVTPQLATRMQEQGLWYTPEEVPQSQVDGMNLRGSLQYVEEFGILNIPPSGQYLLVKGDGPALSTSQLSGNGDAVYAIDRNGNKYHVTGAVAEQMQKAGTWMTPAVLNQGTVDSIDLRGALASASGGVVGLTVPVGDPTVVNVVGSTVSSSGVSFKLVRGDGPNLGTSQLKGNGAAVYAVFDNGRKLHVTAAMAEQMVNEGKWVEPTIMNQAELDKTQPTGTLASLSGDWRPLEVQFVSGTASTSPGTSAPVGVPSAPSFKLVRGDGPNLGTSQLKGNGAAVYAVFDNGRKLHVTAAMAEQIVKEGKWVEPTIVNQAELDSTPPMGALASLSGDYRPLEILFEAPSASAGASTPTTTPASSSFKLVRGNGPNMGTKQLIGNGAAVYAVFDDGSKKLHVTAAMAEQLVKDGKWQEPAVIDQKELDSTPVGGTLADTSGKVGVLEVPLVEATPLPSSNDTRHMETMPVILPDDPTETAPSVPSTPKPAWQPDPVVDRTGEERDLMDPKYGYDMNERIEIKNHVYQGGGTFEELDQIAAIYDSGDAQRIDDWERFSQTGKYAPGAIAAVATPAPAPSTPVNNFKLVRGNGPGLGNSHLMGNGAAVYAIFDDGRKLHVTGAMAGELQRQGRWTEPEIWDQASLDQTPPAGTLADVNGAVGALEVQWLPPAPAVAEPPAPAPVAAPAAPVIEMLADRTGAQKPLNSLSAADIAHINGGGTFQEIDQVAAIYASGDKTAIENWERFTLTGKFAPTSAYGMEYQKAISEGIDPATATYWCNSKFGFI
jgi:hypothetical protein